MDIPPEAKALYDSAIVVDATCPLLRRPEFLPWYVEGGLTAVAPTVGSALGAQGTLKNLGRWARMIRENPGYRLVRLAADIEAAKRERQLGIVLHFQGTEPLEDDLDLVDAYKALGVGVIQLAYNVRNRYGDGCEEPGDAGLSRLGRRLVERFNAARVIVDCSHTGYRTTMDAIERSSRPVIFSHANARAVHPSNRNVTDEQIRAIAATGGAIGINGFPGFVGPDARPSIDRFIDHMAYMADLVGIDHVALGIDYYDGQAGVVDDATAVRLYQASLDAGRWTADNYPPPPHYYPETIETPRTFPHLAAAMLRRGFAEGDIRKVLGLNWLRVYREVWGG